MTYDGRKHKVDVVSYKQVPGMFGKYRLLRWRLTLTCGHTVGRTGGRESSSDRLDARQINGSYFVGVPRRVACDVCRDLIQPAIVDQKPPEPFLKYAGGKRQLLPRNPQARAKLGCDEEGSSMSHEWRKLEVAQHYEWGALALCRVHAGPSVTVSQCRGCGAVRFSPEGGNDDLPVYAINGYLETREPPYCC